MPTGLGSRPTFSCSHRFLHERADPCLVGGGQLRQSEGGRPHGAFIEVRLVAEAERRVPRLELLRALEEADDVAVLGISGHPVPESRRKAWRAGFDDRMKPLAYGAIRFRHLVDLREHGAFPIRIVRARAAARGRLELLDALPHRDSFLGREYLELLVDRRGVLGGLLRVLLWAHGSSRLGEFICAACLLEGIAKPFRSNRVDSLPRKDGTTGTNVTTANGSALDGRQIEPTEPVWIRQNFHLNDLPTRNRETDHGKQAPD